MSRLTLIPLVIAAGCVQLPEEVGDDTGGGKADGASSELFGDSGPSELRLEGAFDPAFSAARAGQPDGIFPQPRITEPFVGALVYRDGERELRLAVELEVRGNSSLSECLFPKLKLKLDQAVAAGTVFADARKLKIGTHCGEGGTGTIGRLREQKATWREAAAYQVMRALGMSSQAVKPVTITYVDTSTSETITRQAFVFEHIDLLAARLGGEGLADPETFAGDPAEVMDAKHIVRVHMFEALLGNWDWQLRLGPADPTEGPQLSNMEAVQLGARLLPVPSDFDLSSFVTARPVRQVDPRVLPGHPSSQVRQAAGYLASQFGPTFEDAELSAARAHFEARRAAVELVIEDVLVDDEGRANLRAHVAAFYEALSHLDEIMTAVR